MSARAEAVAHLHGLDKLTAIARLNGKSEGLHAAAVLIGEFAKTATPDDTALLGDLLREVVKRHEEVASELRSAA